MICKFFVVALGGDFEYLALALGLFFLPLAMIMANPAMAAPALSFAFVFCYVVKPDNPMVYDLSDTINSPLPFSWASCSARSPT